MRPLKYLLPVLLFAFALPAAAQEKLSFSLRSDKYVPMTSANIAHIIQPRPADNLLYGFPPVVTEAQRRSEARAKYQRYLFNNKNGNGFIGNLLGIQRVRPARGGVPRF
jgi:hypothetical protein